MEKCSENKRSEAVVMWFVPLCSFCYKTTYFLSYRPLVTVHLEREREMDQVLNWLTPWTVFPKLSFSFWKARAPLAAIPGLYSRCPLLKWNKTLEGQIGNKINSFYLYKLLRNSLFLKCSLCSSLKSQLCSW